MPTSSATLRIAGTVALVAGGYQALTGLKGVLGVDEAVATPAQRNVDSELRFYGVWYAVAGAAMHTAASSPDVHRSLQPLITAGWGLSALSRLASARAVGRLHDFFLGLTVLEAALAALLLRRRAERPDSRSQPRSRTRAPGWSSEAVTQGGPFVV